MLLVGATLQKAEIPYWNPKIPMNMWMRVFPNSDGLVPILSDERYQYLLQNQPVGKRIVFVSSKLVTKWSGDWLAGATTVINRIKALIDAGFIVFYCDQHEPEGDMTPERYKETQNRLFDLVDQLPPFYRERVRVGHALTRQYTESSAPGKGNFDYSKYDTGRGDFFGVDMYGDSWKGNTNTVTDSYLTPVTFLQYFKRYKFNATDTRPRCFPELGYIGAPFDTSGQLRANWIQGVYDEVKTWGPATTGWQFLGFIWWNTEGKSGTLLQGAGVKRWFQLDRRHNGQDIVIENVSYLQAGYDTLVVPHPLTKFNSIVSLENNPAPPQGPSEAELQEAFDRGYIAGDIAGYSRGVAERTAAVEVARQQALEEGRAQGRREGEAAMRVGILNQHREQIESTTPIY